MKSYTRRTVASLCLSFSLAFAPHQSPREFAVPTKVVPPPSPYAARGVTYENITAACCFSRYQPVAGGSVKSYLPRPPASGVAGFDYGNAGWLDICLVTALSTAAQ